MYNLKDDQTMQNLLLKLFRDVKELPEGATVMTLSENKKKEWLISMMSICDETMLKPFRDYEDVEVDLSLRYEPNPDDKGLDLIVRVDTYVPTEHLIFETVIPYLQNNEQKVLAEKLLEKSKFTLFLVGESRQLEYAIRVNYNIEPYRTMLDSVTGKEYFPTKCIRCGKVYNLEMETDNFICKHCQTKEIYGDYEL